MPEREGINSWRMTLASIVAVMFSLFHLWNCYTGAFPGQQLTTIHLTGVLVMGFLIKPAWLNRLTRTETVLSLVLILLAIGSGWYLFEAYHTYTFRSGSPTTTDIIWGIILIFLVLEVTRRFVGNSLTILAIIFLAYMYFGLELPSIVGHRGFSIREIAETMYLTTEGIHGLPMQVSARYIIMFVIFGAVLQQSGAGQFLIDLALTLFGRVRGGPGKVAVMASALFGTISGSAVANVMVDGWLTIPLMKRTGFKPEFAAATEAVASTGGQIMPPVMGAAAFIMVEFTGIPYAQIAIAAAVPALLYYFGLFMMLDFEALRHGWDKKAAQAAIGNARPSIHLSGFLHLIPIIGLIYFMFIKSYTPFLSALYASLLAMVVAQIFPRNHGIRKILTSLRDGAVETIEVAAACGAAGIIIGSLTQTGIGVRLSGILVELSGGNLYLILMLGMLSSLILGMGMPTMPCYIIVAITLVPALVKMGVLLLPAHLFVFYFGVMSMITPPVALAAYAAAGIAKSDPFKTGWTAFRLALSGFIIPYLFVLGPSLLLIGSPLEVVQSIFTATLGIIGLSAAIVGYGLSHLTWWERVVLGISGVLLAKVGTITDITGIIGMGLIAIRQFLRWKRCSSIP